MKVPWISRLCDWSKLFVLMCFGFLHTERFVCLILALLVQLLIKVNPVILYCVYMYSY